MSEKNKKVGRKKMFYSRVLIGLDRENFDWLVACSLRTGLSYSEILERTITRFRFGI